MFFKPFLSGMSGIAVVLCVSLLSGTQATAQPAALTPVQSNAQIAPPAPAALAISPIAPYAYVLGNGDSGMIYPSPIQSDGSLGSPGTPVSFNDDGNLLAMHPRGTTLYAIADMNLLVYALDATTGALTLTQSLAFSIPQQSEYQQSSVALDPAGTSLYILQTKSQTTSSQSPSYKSLLLAYSINAADGSLTPLPGSPFAWGIDAQEIAVGPNGNHVLVAFGPGAGKGKGSLASYSRNPGTGLINATAIGKQTLRTNNPGSLVVAGGGFAYLGENTPTSNKLISVYKLDTTTGALAATAFSGQVPTASGTASATSPYLALSPQGAALYAMGGDIGAMQMGFMNAFTVNADGSLTVQDTLTYPTIGINPNDMKIHPSSRFVYTTNAGNINGWTGLTSLRTNVPRITLTLVTGSLDSARFGASLSDTTGWGVSRVSFHYGTSLDNLDSVVVATGVNGTEYAAIGSQSVPSDRTYYVKPSLVTAAGFTFVGDTASIWLPGNPLTLRPVVSYNKDSLILSQTLSVDAGRMKLEDIQSEGFHFYPVGFSTPDQAPAASVNAPVLSSGANNNTFRVATVVPPASPYSDRKLYDSVYVAVPFIQLRARKLYGLPVTVSVKPFVKTDSLWSSVVAGTRQLITFSGKLNPDRITGANGFTVSNTPDFITGTRKLLPVGIWGVSYQTDLYRDSLKKYFALPDALPLDTFYVKAWAVFNGDTLFGSAKSFTNTAPVALEKVSVGPDNAVMIVRIQPWALSDDNVEIRAKQGKCPTKGTPRDLSPQWDAYASCNANADCTVPNLAPETRYCLYGKAAETTSTNFYETSGFFEILTNP